MARFYPTKLVALAVLLFVTFNAYLVIQNFAIRNKNNNQIPRTLSFPFSSALSAFGEQYPCTQENIELGNFENCFNWNGTTGLKDANMIQTWLEQSFDSRENEQLLSRFNLSVNNGQFDPINLLKDKYLYLTLKQVDQLDQILHQNQINSPIDSDIDKRRSQGKITNFKASDFANITQLIHGVTPCDTESGSNLQAVVFVITKPDDFAIRSLIRKTWGAKFADKESTLKLYFTFGLASSGDLTKSEFLVKEESAQFGDIIQWNFEDGYYRLTIKSVAILRWASVYCSRVPVVFKIDADCILNYDRLTEFTNQVQPNLTNHQYIYGNLWQNASVIRSTKSKFFTSFSDYPHKTYPDYIGGPWYLAGRTLSLFLYREAVLHSMPALVWEDLYVTGIVAQKLIDTKFPLERKRMNGFVYDVNYKKIDYQQYNRSIILTQAVDQSNLEKVWERIKQGELSVR